MTDKPTILDLFAGPGGWDEGLSLNGLDDVIGLELDTDACATAEAAGHRRRQVDIAMADPDEYAGVAGLVASPPCQDWSSAGRAASSGTGHLVHEALRWAEALRPDWLLFEQVRGVLPLWHDFAHRLRTIGYRTTVTLVDAASYGVPQHRVRAILMGSLTTSPRIPSPTHGGMFTPYRTMSDTVGWDGVLDRRQNSRGPQGTVVPVALVPSWRPSPTVTGAAAAGQWRYRPTGADWQLVTTDEAAALQGFRPDYPWSGPSKRSISQQIGNAVPPPLAQVLSRQFALNPVR